MFGQSNAVQLQPAVEAARFLTLDIETTNAPEDAIERAMALWKAPSNWLPETVERKRDEAMEKIRSKSALLDAAEIICIAAQTDRESAIIHGMNSEQFPIDGWTCLGFGDERRMLLAFREWANAVTDECTVIVVQNAGFDLPHLRSAYIRHRLQPPGMLALGSDREVFDTMRVFRAFSHEHRDSPFVALDVIAAGLGIEMPKQHVSGADVPDMHKRGEYHEICMYCCLDVAVTTQAYLLMSGLHGSLE